MLPYNLNQSRETPAAAPASLLHRAFWVRFNDSTFRGQWSHSLAHVYSTFRPTLAMPWSKHYTTQHPAKAL